MERARSTWTDERLDDLSRRVEDGFSRIDKRIDAVEGRLGDRIDAVETRLGARLEGLAARIDGLGARIDGLQRTTMVTFVAVLGTLASVLVTQA